MPKKYPQLSRREVLGILKAWNFCYKRSHGDDDFYEGFTHGRRRLVKVQSKVKAFWTDRIISMIAQSGLSREEFYGATKTTAKKINVPFKKPG